MKILNPNFVSPVLAPSKKPPHERYRQAVLDALATLAAKAEPSFGEVRAELGLDAAKLPDGAIHQICIDAGIKVEREEGGK